MGRIRDGAEIRKERLKELMNLIQHNPDLDEKRIKGIYMLKTGLTMNKIDEHVDELVIAGIVIRENGKLSLST